nr:redoxin domain-containing protein [Legionella jordanis]
MSACKAVVFALLWLLTFQWAQAADVILTTLDGQKIPFSSLKGKWVFINYWASWCQPCLDEIHALNRFYEHQKKDVALFAVNFDMLAAEEQLQLIKKHRINYPSLQNDPAQVLHLKNIPGVPATFVFNPEGKLSQTLFGPQTLLSLNEVIGQKS